MVSFKTNVDNNEYITIKKLDLSLIIVSDGRPDDIRDEANEIFCKSIQFEKKEKILFIDEIQIKKDSLLGKFLLDNGMSDEIRNEDLYVSYEDVVNAFNIAAYEDNLVFYILCKLFKKREEGSVIELSEKYGNEVINYISSNKDFNAYLKKQDGAYNPKEYIVYEDGEFSKKTLLNNQKQKVK